ncbi:MAG TPA: hypothetical protein VFD69_13755 [Vicinamibacterales bacterium]|jgi:hypothetical protein|nr:hypothetical protein [Vicinamibacterales bacterium]
MEPAPATIVLSRTSPDDVGIREIYVSIDGQDVGVLRPGDRVEKQVNAGRHVVKAHNTLFRRTREIDLSPGETAEFLGVNKAGGGSMVMSILMAVLGVGALKLEFERVIAP